MCQDYFECVSHEQADVMDRADWADWAGGNKADKDCV